MSSRASTPFRNLRTRGLLNRFSSQGHQRYTLGRYGAVASSGSPLPMATTAGSAANPPIQDVARQADVAIGTVSNVLNNPDKVTERTRLKVEAAIAELGFVRNSAARALAARRTDTVGLILIDIGNSLFVDIARGAESAASQAQLRLLLANSDSTRTKQDNYLELLDQARVAGVLLTPLEEPLDVAHAVLGHGRPVVLVIASSADPLMCSVIVNEELGGYLAATHLLQADARRLVFLAGLPELRLIRRRLAGVERAAAEAGASLSVVGAPNLGIATGRDVGRDVLPLPVEWTAWYLLQIC